MTHDCPSCGKKKSVKEYKTEEFSDMDYANINIFSEDPMHSLDILYLLPPWRCQACQSVMLRGTGEREIAKTEHKCGFCRKGKLVHYENAAVGDIVVRDTFEKVGQLTIDEALICDNCSHLRVMETGKEVGD